MVDQASPEDIICEPEMTEKLFKVIIIGDPTGNRNKTNIGHMRKISIKM